ncbi:hypothetical protein NRB_26380 [Novosphingobium sp. 11B]
MNVNAELFDTGPDYQKAKQSAFAISILVFLACLAVPDPNGRFEFEALDVKVSAPLLVIQLLLLAILAYAAYGFRINRRRAFIEHTKLVRKFGDVSLYEALTGIKAEFESILASAKALATNFAGAASTMANIESMKQETTDHWLDQISQHHQESVDSILDTIAEPADDSSAELERFKAEMRTRAAVPTSNYIFAIKEQFDRKVDEVSTHRYRVSIYNLSTSAERLNAATAHDIPVMKAAILAMESAMSTVSDKIAPEEVRFFFVETAVVFLALGGSGLFLLYRLAQHIPFRTIWQNLGC